MLKRRSKEPALVGLEIEAGSVAAAEIRLNGTARLTATAAAPISPEVVQDGEVRDPERLAHELRRLFTEHRLSKRVRLGIANQRVVVRTMRLPAIDDPAELDSAIRFNAQEQIAMPLDQAVVDHRVVGGGPGGEGAPPQIDVMVVAARRDMIATSLKPLRDAGLEPAGVDLSAFGMIRALGEHAVAAPAAGEPDAEPAPRATLFCNVGDVTNLAIAKGRSCLFTRISPAGLDNIAGGLASTTQLSHEHAQLWLNHVGLALPPEQVEGDPDLVAQVRRALERGATSLLDELRLSIDFYGAQEAAVPIEQVVLCGPGSAIPGLAEHMSPSLGLPVRVGVPYALSGFDAASAARLTLPYGLALEQ
jgi:type IV pilus assembly protein PilM